MDGGQLGHLPNELVARYRRHELSACECGGPIVGRRADARYCSRRLPGQDAPARLFENASAQASIAIRRLMTNLSRYGRRRLICDTAAVLHPGELQRPFKEPYASEEPDWLAAELAPPKLAMRGLSGTSHRLTAALPCH